MPIERVGVIGAGTMGNGIAHVFARSGYQVTLCDVEQRFLDRALETIARNLDREVAKSKASAEDRAAALKRITPALQRAQLANCDFVIEAATEKFEVKAEIFRDLDRICRAEVLLASNTSSISITKLAAVTKRPEKTIGMHFFNPVPLMKLVEVIRGLATAQETFETVRDLVLKLDKTPVEVNDAPGFVSNRVHRTRRLPRHHASAAGWHGRSQVPAVSIADQDGRCRLVGEEERERVLHVLSPKLVALIGVGGQTPVTKHQ